MTTIDGKTMLTTIARVGGEGRGTEFRNAPTAENAAVLVTALAASLAKLSGLSYKSILEATTAAKQPRAGTPTAAAGPATSPAAGYKKGDKINAPWEGKMYGATIDTVKGSTVAFTWDAGGTGEAEMSAIKAVGAKGPAKPAAAAAPTYAKDAPVKAKWADDGKWYPATVISAGKEAVMVKFDDGGAKQKTALADVKAA